MNIWNAEVLGIPLVPYFISLKQYKSPNLYFERCRAIAKVILKIFGYSSSVMHSSARIYSGTAGEELIAFSCIF